MNIVFAGETLVAPEGFTIGVAGPDAGMLLEAARTAGAAVYELKDLDTVARMALEIEMERARRSAAPVLLAALDETHLQRLADEVWIVREGRVVAKGDPQQVLASYLREALRNFKHPEIAPALRRGDGRARLLAIELLNAEGQPVALWHSGDIATVRIVVRFDAPVADPVIGIIIRSRVGMEVYGTNTELEKLKLGPCAAGELREVRYTFRCDLCPQHYTLTAASHDPDGVWHDWLEDAVAFTVADTRYTAGVANLRAKVEARPLLSFENVSGR